MKLCIEFIILNLTAIKAKKKTKTLNFKKFSINKGVFVFFLCKYNKGNNKYIIANNSTKSQLHQPPQDSSCSAHQAPSTIAKKTNSICIVVYLLLLLL